MLLWVGRLVDGWTEMSGEGVGGGGREGGVNRKREGRGTGNMADG